MADLECLMDNATVWELERQRTAPEVNLVLRQALRPRLVRRLGHSGEACRRKAAGCVKVFSNLWVPQQRWAPRL